MERERLEKQFSFIREIDREKFIGRQTYLTDGERKENDAEHAWHTAVMTLLLAEYANEEIDVLKTVTMLLIHDIVEIDAGDTYAYDEEAKKTQKDRERKAAERIYGLLPADQGEKLKELWQEFEACATPRGTAFLQEICALVDVPVWAIGGIHMGTGQMEEILSCGAAGGCIMSEMMRI